MKRLRSVASQIFEFKPFSKKQRKVLNWWCDDSPVKDKDGIIADGAIRSGKTICMSLSFVMWAMHRYENKNFGMCGKTIGSFRRNVLFWLKLMLRSRGYRVVDHRADNMVEVYHNGKANMFYIFGGKDESSQDLIQGITLAGAFFDEVALMPESFVNQATGRCSVDGSKFWFNCNPDGPYHWFKVEWIDRAVGYIGRKKANDFRKAGEVVRNLLYIHFTMEDNLSLSEAIRERYRSNYKGVFYKRYIEGLWAMAEGVIYDMFNVSAHVFKRLTGQTNERYYVSCDYGTQNATVFLLWQQGADGRWYCIKEYYYSGRDEQAQKTDEAYADDLKKFLGNIKPTSIILDPSAASFRATLKKRKYRVKNARNDVLDGIRFVATQLALGKIAFAECCVNTIKEFGSYTWDSKACEKGEDRPIKMYDHSMDAVRYFCYTIMFKHGGVTI